MSMNAARHDTTGLNKTEYIKNPEDRFRLI